MSTLVLLLALLGLAILARAESMVLPANCDAAKPLVISYVNRHGISVYGYPSVALSGSANKYILDAKGERIDMFRARREFATSGKGDWLTWSPGIPRSGASLTFAPDQNGCSVDLKIWFGSSGTVTFIVIVPVDGARTWQSNGKLEQEFLRAMTAAIPKDPASN